MNTLQAKKEENNGSLYNKVIKNMQNFTSSISDDIYKLNKNKKIGKFDRDKFISEFGSKGP